MAFGAATVLTNAGKALTASQVNGTTSTPPKYIAIGVGATGAARTAAVTDTALSNEVAEGRATGTNTIVTTNVTGDTFQTVGTITASGARAVDEAGLFTAVSSGTMALSATFPVVNLANLDSIQITAKIKYA